MSNHIQVVTHSGIFHADEVFACAALSIAYGRDNLDAIRNTILAETGILVGVEYIN